MLWGLQGLCVEEDVLAGLIQLRGHEVGKGQHVGRLGKGLHHQVGCLRWGQHLHDQGGLCS